MFRKRKRKITTKTDTILCLSYFESDLECFEKRLEDFEKMHRCLTLRVVELEQKVKQLERKHNFRFDKFSVSTLYIKGVENTKYVHHKCTECGKTVIKRWDNIAKKGQQALKLLNLVPKDWKIKGDK